MHLASVATLPRKLNPSNNNMRRKVVDVACAQGSLQVDVALHGSDGLSSSTEPHQYARSEATKAENIIVKSEK